MKKEKFLGGKEMCQKGEKMGAGEQKTKKSLNAVAMGEFSEGNSACMLCSS